jgi:hypothetical protein
MIRQPEIPRPTVAHEHPLTYLGELVSDVIAALSVPDRYGRWDLHRWESR